MYFQVVVMLRMLLRIYEADIGQKFKNIENRKNTILIKNKEQSLQKYATHVGTTYLQK